MICSALVCVQLIIMEMRKLMPMIDTFTFLAAVTTLTAPAHIFFYILYRLEWESAILRGCSTFRRMEEDRLNQLRYLAEQYQQILDEHRPKLVSNAHRLDEPIRRIHVSRDMEVVRKKVIIQLNYHSLIILYTYFQEQRSSFFV